MISFLRGRVVSKQPPEVVLDVNGVGYAVQASMNTFYHLPDAGQVVEMLTHLIVREDAHTLYGFLESAERELFCTLLKVNGVGPKLAITILSNMSPDVFVQCIATNSLTELVRLPGVGKKTAERLLIEMRDRLAHWALTPAVAIDKSLPPSINQVVQDAISALIALGYKPQEAAHSVKKLAANDLSREELIRQALQQMG